MIRFLNLNFVPRVQERNALKFYANGNQIKTPRGILHVLAAVQKLTFDTSITCRTLAWGLECGLCSAPLSSILRLNVSKTVKMHMGGNLSLSIYFLLLQSIYKKKTFQSHYLIIFYLSTFNHILTL